MHSAIMESEGVVNPRMVFRNVIFMVIALLYISSACITFVLLKNPMFIELFKPWNNVRERRRQEGGLANK